MRLDNLKKKNEKLLCLSSAVSKHGYKNQTVTASIFVFALRPSIDNNFYYFSLPLNFCSKTY